VAFAFKPNSIGPTQTDGLVTPADGKAIRIAFTGTGMNIARKSP
jgi:hypothetical protein